MADNKVEIIVAARDMASGVFSTLTQATRSYHSTLAAMNGTANQVSSTIKNMFLAFGGYSVIQNAISSGFKFNETIEDTRVGIASLIFSMKDFTDASGNVVTGQRAFDAALRMSEDVQDRLRIAGLKTAATYEQLVKAYSQSYVPAIKAGFDETQIVKFSVAVTQAATAMRVPLDMLGEEVRSVLQGNMTPRNTMLQPLFEAAGLTNEKIKELAKSGKLYESVMKALQGAAIGAAESSKNFSVILSNLKDAISQAMGKGMEKTFSATKTAMKDLTDSIVQFDEKTGKITWGEGFMSFLKTIDDKAAGAIKSISDLGKEIADFKTKHPVITELSSAFAQFLGGIAVKVAVGIIALRALGGIFIFIRATWMANLAFLTTLFGAFIGFLEAQILKAVTTVGMLSSVCGVAAVAVAAVGAAFVGWQLGKYITQMEIFGLTIGEAMQAGYASVGKFFAYTTYAWDMIGATGKAVWGSLKQSIAIVFYEVINIMKNIPGLGSLITAAFGDVETKKTAAFQAMASYQQKFRQEQDAAGATLKANLAHQDDIRESIFREADARKIVSGATEKANKNTEDLTASAKKGAKAATEYALSHADVNGVLDKMSDILDKGKLKIAELTLDIQKLTATEHDVKLIDIDKTFAKNIAALKQQGNEAARTVRELEDKIAKASEKAADENKKGDTTKTKVVDSKVYADLAAAKQKEIEIQKTINAAIVLEEKKKNISINQENLGNNVRLQSIRAGQAEEYARLTGSVKEQYQAQAASLRARLDEEMADTKKSMEERLAIRRNLLVQIEQAEEAAQGSIVAGWRRGFNEYLRSMKTTFDYGRQMAEETATAMESALSDFFFDTITGKLKSLGDYINSFLLGVARALSNAMAQQGASQIIMGVKTAASAIGQYYGGSGAASTEYRLGPTTNAYGNAFANGRITPFANGDIVHRPTFFPMANGGVGLMGEAGYPEAIMPLTRMGNGKLGVQAMGGGQFPQSVKVVIINESGQKQKATGSDVSFNLQEMVVTVFLDALDRNAYGLGSALGR